MEQEENGVVFDIAHYMLEDGTGIRTNVFLKGCPLHCQWCSNAYGLKSYVQMAHVQSKCIGCFRCVGKCPQHAILCDGKKVVTDFTKCINCMNCVDVCPAGARRQIGKRYTVSQVVKEVEKDRMYYRRGNGGITLSGGEILLQPDFAEAILKECRYRFIDTAVETSACGKWEDLERILRQCDQAFIDCKAIDSNLHRELTGMDNQKILDNIRKAALFCSRQGIRLIIRFPFIPGKNDMPDNLKKIADFVKKLEGEPLLNILPYHNYGAGKYADIGETYLLEKVEVPTKENILYAKAIMDQMGVNYTVGGFDI